MSLRRPTAACRFIFTFWGVASDTRSVFSYFIGISGGLPPDFLFIYHVVQILLSECALQICSCASCLHLLYLMSKLSCEYIQSTHLACWFGQMLTKVILWIKSSIASPTPRGVPVSPVRSWIWSLVLYTLPLPRIKVIEPHSDARWVVRFRSHVTHFTVTYPPPLLLRVSSYATILLVSYPSLCIISACL